MREWDFDEEIRLFRAICHFKPCGKNRNFHMVALINRMNGDKDQVIGAQDIRSKLDSLYDVEKLNELEDISDGGDSDESESGESEEEGDTDQFGMVYKEFSLVPEKEYLGEKLRHAVDSTCSSPSEIGDVEDEKEEIVEKEEEEKEEKQQGEDKEDEEAEQELKLEVAEEEAKAEKDVEANETEADDVAKQESDESVKAESEELAKENGKPLVPEEVEAAAEESDEEEKTRSRGRKRKSTSNSTPRPHKIQNTGSLGRRTRSSGTQAELKGTPDKKKKAAVRGTRKSLRKK